MDAMRGASDPRRFEVSETSTLRLLWILLPMLSFLALTAYYARDTAQPAAGPFSLSLSPPYFTMGGSAGWSVLVVVVLAVVLSWKFFNRRVQLDGDMLEVRSTLYRRRTPVAQMDLDRAEVVDLKGDRHHGLRYKTNAYSVPGFHSGHYRLSGGGKGFALVTDTRRVLVIPVRGGPTLLLSLVQPQALLAALRKAIG